MFALNYEWFFIILVFIVIFYMFLKFFEHLSSLVNETWSQILPNYLTRLLGLVTGDGLIYYFFVDIFLSHLEGVSVVGLLGFFLESGRLVAMIHWDLIFLNI